ncbi:MAG: DUF1028 domain-containing protein [candidate division KSB1 bacterium]|nr:DUF1028 domain-containing protein [candidate division KSB1 bacterium]MDZ7319219.1 DUF1028 domain-containing protein [candidate division KSB1 bacterium]MDZ7341786.1 DUF1028 domain-containing protein [candidate division KSB1 bacterium]
MRKILFVSSMVFFLVSQSSVVVSQSVFSNPLVHTYSIVARDSVTGELGVAVQSHWFSVGSIVSWAEAGVGAIATQSFVNVSFGPRGLELLRQGKTASEALQILIDSDEGRDVRQLAIIDATGNVAAYTGKNCIPDAGHIVGGQYSVQANLMLNDKVWPAMARAFEQSAGPLAERMLAALAAAQKAGGDIRGRQSAAILVVKGKSSGKVWEDRLIDLRVEDHPEPIQEIQRLLRLYRAYEFMNQGDLAVEKNDIAGALHAYGAAEKMFPDNLEMKYWHAVSLANVGMVEDAIPIFRSIFKKDRNWRLLTERLPGTGLLKIGAADLERILLLR